MVYLQIPALLLISVALGKVPNLTVPVGIIVAKDPAQRPMYCKRVLLFAISMNLAMPSLSRSPSKRLKAHQGNCRVPRCGIQSVPSWPLSVIFHTSPM